jgi:nicotinamidase-related amidase
MTLASIDAVSALVVIDLQNGIVALPTAHAAGEIVGRASAVARAFREHGLPVVLVNVAGSPPGRTDTAMRSFPASDDWSDLVPELDRQPDDYTVTKHQWGAFYGTSLDSYLRSRGVTQVFLAGISTSKGVESTARNAHEHGYNVALITDAMTDTDLEAHRNSLERIFPRVGQTTNTEEVLALLNSRKPDLRGG